MQMTVWLIKSLGNPRDAMTVCHMSNMDDKKDFAQNKKLCMGPSASPHLHPRHPRDAMAVTCQTWMTKKILHKIKIHLENFFPMHR